MQQPRTQNNKAMKAMTVQTQMPNGAIQIGHTGGALPLDAHYTPSPNTFLQPLKEGGWAIMKPEAANVSATRGTLPQT